MILPKLTIAYNFLNSNHQQSVEVDSFYSKVENVFIDVYLLKLVCTKRPINKNQKSKKQENHGLIQNATKRNEYMQIKNKLRKNLKYKNSYKK